METGMSIRIKHKKCAKSELKTSLYRMPSVFLFEKKGDIGPKSFIVCLIVVCSLRLLTSKQKKEK